MSHEYVYKISSRCLKKWLRYNIKHVKNRHFSHHFGTLPWFYEFCFLTDFDASKSVLGSFFAFFAKIWPNNMYRSSKSRFFFTFFTWWPEMTLTCIMVTKHRKWYLQMSVTLSMPIHWLCLRLTSKFYSPMSPSPKSRKFWLWPDLWRHQWPPGQILDLVRVVHVQGYRIAFEIWKSVQQFGRSQGGPFAPPPPPAGRVTNQTPAGRGLR